MSKINPQISGNFVIRVAELYNDFNRAIMEYIDNSLDSAEIYYNEDENAYQREIYINITIHTKEEKIIIQDNCTGIEDLNSLIQIGNSKKTDFTTNGQFGFGIYSFMAGCDVLEFYSRFANKKTYYLKICREDFVEEDVRDVQINEANVSRGSIEKGTKVILSKFKTDIWRYISVDEVKEYIANHFELLLKRRNIFVTVNDETIEPYNYDKFEDEDEKKEIWQDQITEAKYTKKGQGRGASKEISFSFKKPIEIYLRMYPRQEVKRPPSFFAKGRRINYVRDIKGFQTRYGRKTILWGHNQITGYIDLKDNFEPTLKRDDFKDIKTDKFKAFNEEMKELEALIYENFILEVNKKKQNRSLSQLARKIEQLLKNLKDEPLNLSNKNDGRSNKGTDNPNNGGVPEELNPRKTRSNKKENTKGQTGIGFDFTDDELVKTEDGRNYIRSKLNEESEKVKQIVIYKEHENFQSVYKTKKVGDLKVTPEFINYIATEITIHYKDEFYNENNAIPNNYSKDVFVQFADLLYKIENLLNPLVGADMNELVN